MRNNNSQLKVSGKVDSKKTRSKEVLYNYGTTDGHSPLGRHCFQSVDDDAASLLDYKDVRSLLDDMSDPSISI